MPTVLITGAASGLGLQFVRHYTKEGHNVVAIDINPIPPTELSTMITGRLRSAVIDIADTAALETFISQTQTNLPIDLVIHCAGIRGLVPSAVQAHPGDVPATETLQVMDAETMQKTFNINTLGTFSLVKALLPNLRLSASNPKVIIMSSRMGSISSNTAGGGYAYRASKAALNAIVKSFSIDVPEVGFLMVHPGRVETGLVSWREEGAVSVEESVRDVVGLVEGLEGRDRWSGGFVDRWGGKIGW